MFCCRCYSIPHWTLWESPAICTCTLTNALLVTRCMQLYIDKCISRHTPYVTVHWQMHFLSPGVCNCALTNAFLVTHHMQTYIDKCISCHALYATVHLQMHFLSSAICSCALANAFHIVRSLRAWPFKIYYYNYSPKYAVHSTISMFLLVSLCWDTVQTKAEFSSA